uniref:Headcase domain-containing protein n=1 Tax=Caenorhabditis tropicalis TaxID=1561998 RepID=A0A1I7U467_9PELO
MQGSPGSLVGRRPLTAAYANNESKPPTGITNPVLTVPALERCATSIVNGSGCQRTGEGYPGSLIAPNHTGAGELTQQPTPYVLSPPSKEEGDPGLVSVLAGIQKQMQEMTAVLLKNQSRADEEYCRRYEENSDGFSVGADEEAPKASPPPPEQTPKVAQVDRPVHACTKKFDATKYLTKFDGSTDVELFLAEFRRVVMDNASLTIDDKYLLLRSVLVTPASSCLAYSSDSAKAVESTLVMLDQVYGSKQSRLKLIKDLGALPFHQSDPHQMKLDLVKHMVTLSRLRDKGVPETDEHITLTISSKLPPIIRRELADYLVEQGDSITHAKLVKKISERIETMEMDVTLLEHLSPQAPNELSDSYDSDEYRRRSNTLQSTRSDKRWPKRDMGPQFELRCCVDPEILRINVDRQYYFEDETVRVNGSVFHKRNDYQKLMSVIPKSKFNGIHIKMEDDCPQGGDDVRLCLLKSLGAHNLRSIPCVMCKDELKVYDKYPLIDGVFYISPVSQFGPKTEIALDGRRFYLQQLCARCLWSDWSCKNCGKDEWFDGRSFVLGTLYYYDIVSAGRCCPTVCQSCKQSLGVRDQLATQLANGNFATINEQMTCQSCNTTGFHLVRDLKTCHVARGPSFCE